MHVTDWRILIDEGCSAAEQMARDVELAAEPIPTLRLFRWDPPAVSLGLKQPPPAWLGASGVAHVERPTGGGIAVHGSDVSVAVILPRAFALPLPTILRATCEATARLCRWYGAEAATLLEAEGHERITYCLTDRSSYAVLVGGRKIAGFALRRFPAAWLIQGSLLVRSLPGGLAQAMPADVLSQFRTRAISLAEAAQHPVAEAEVMEAWGRQWPAWWEEITSLRAQGSRFRAVAQNPEPPPPSQVVVGVANAV